jgi:DNA-binding response OmpR family regulator
MNTNEDFLQTRPATALRPLLGLTVLVVEDSRFACEALRLLCLRSGARIRRADSLYHASQHLKVYRPCVLIVDVGLPDGDGTELIEKMSVSMPRSDVILGISGDPNLEQDVLAAGANGFLPKPFASIGEFQNAILKHLPANRQPPGPRLVNDEKIKPDMIAYHDDLTHVAQFLENDEGDKTIDYLTQFLSGISRSVDDAELDGAVTALIEKRSNGEPLRPQMNTLAAIVQTRLASAGPI